MVVWEDCHGTALHKGLEIAHGSELRTVNIFTSAFASNTTTDYVNRLTAARPPTDAHDMTSKRAEVLLGSGNYFHWEYNMCMTLARKGLLAHVEVVKPRTTSPRRGSLVTQWRLVLSLKVWRYSIRPRFGLRRVRCMRGCASRLL